MIKFGVVSILFLIKFDWQGTNGKLKKEMFFVKSCGERRSCEK